MSDWLASGTNAAGWAFWGASVAMLDNTPVWAVCIVSAISLFVLSTFLEFRARRRRWDL
jgi:hypothetical protein